MKRSSLLLFFIVLCFSLQAQEFVTLTQVIGKALEQNHNVLLASNQQLSLETEQKYGNGAFLPTINAQGGVVWNRNHQDLEFMESSRNNSGDARSRNLTGTVQLNYTLFDGGKMFITQDRLRSMSAYGEMMLKNEMTNTISQVIKAYYDVVRQKQRLKAVQEQLLVNEERVKLADRKLQVGTGGKPELLQAKVDYNAMQTQVFEQEALIKKLKQQLNILVGNDLPNVFDVSDSIEIDMKLSLDEFENLENTNYALRATRYNVAAAQYQLSERIAERYPTLSFTGAYNVNTLKNSKLINPFGPMVSQTNGFNYGFTVNMPILNNRNVSRQVMLAKINEQRQLIAYDQQKKTLSTELINAYTDYENAKRILVIEEENILLAKENVFIALEGFKRAVTTFIELRTAQQSLEDAYNRLINARYLAKVAETELLRLNGQLLKED
jgi:outer membrane protein